MVNVISQTRSECGGQDKEVVPSCVYVFEITKKNRWLTLGRLCHTTRNIANSLAEGRIQGTPILEFLGFFLTRERPSIHENCRPFRALRRMVGARQTGTPITRGADRQRDPPELGREDPRNSGHGQSHPMLPSAGQVSASAAGHRGNLAPTSAPAAVAARALVKRARSLRSPWPRSFDDSRPSPASAPANADGRLRLFRISRARSTNHFCESVRGSAKGAAAPEWMVFVENSSRERHRHLRMPGELRSDSSL
jgi:hypothetical protein